MADSINELPADLQLTLLSIIDDPDLMKDEQNMQALAEFVVQHSAQYPVLLNMLIVDEDRLTKHIEETGNIPPGVKAWRTTTKEGSNVTKVEIFHGPTTVPKEYD